MNGMVSENVWTVKEINIFPGGQKRQRQCITGVLIKRSAWGQCGEE